MAAAKTKPAADLAYLCRALKAPTLARSVERLGERARADGWSHEEFLTACLEREVAARQSNGGEIRIRAARFPVTMVPGRGVNFHLPQGGQFSAAVDTRDSIALNPGVWAGKRSVLGMR